MLISFTALVLLQSNLHISHHTGALLMALSFHTKRLIKLFKFPTLSQKTSARIDIFLALQCEGTGRSARMTETRAKIGRVTSGMANWWHLYVPEN